MRTQPSTCVSLNSADTSEGHQVRAYRVLFAASNELGAIPTACGSPFARSGDTGNPSPSAARLHSADCTKKKFGKPTLTRPAKPCTDDRKRAPLADWNALGGVKISDFLKNGSRPDQVHVLSLLSCPQASYCSFSARGWGVFFQNVTSAGVVTRGTYEYHAIDDGAPAEGLPGVHCEGTIIEVRLWDGCVGLITFYELGNNLNRAGYSYPVERRERYPSSDEAWDEHLDPPV